MSFDRPQRFSNAPAGMGLEYVNLPRKPLSEFVGASEELNLGAFMKGERNFEPWDPMDFNKLSKVTETRYLPK